jgi:hypothetical protein
LNEDIVDLSSTASESDMFKPDLHVAAGLALRAIQRVP